MGGRPTVQRKIFAILRSEVKVRYVYVQWRIELPTENEAKLKENFTLNLLRCLLLHNDGTEPLEVIRIRNVGNSCKWGISKNLVLGNVPL